MTMNFNRKIKITNLLVRNELKLTILYLFIPFALLGIIKMLNFIKKWSQVSVLN